MAEAEALRQLTGHSEQAAAANAASAYELQVAPFRLSITERKLWKDGKEIILTPTEWALVRLLMERVGESVSRDRILTEVWGRYYVGDLKVVDVNIRRIRQKIEKNPSDPAFIETVWGYGYRWKRGGNG
ncbi:winged helix-turn-helix domain-containing protein [Paenibacillus vietnamensis]|uniref:winged helix-turn-helix domain-containing protein n=1 Tax=Paenibacillus vietnamensis TaxID=2590547 RepID=UPI001CD0AA82|nr:helix-turn-helix domain-containing protein [Paenibacillus vietnamensis]